MGPDEESQSFTTESKVSRNHGWRMNCFRTICVSIVTSLCTCCCIAWLLYNIVHIKEIRQYDTQNNSLSQPFTEHFKMNWTVRSSDRDNTNASRSKQFQTDSHGCILIPKTGHWLVHSEITFAYSNTSQDQIWVYMQVNNGTMPVKKTITLPNKQYRGGNAHLPVDLTDVIYFNERDVLCVVVSEWRTVYASEADNSLTLVYLSMGS